MSNEKLPMYGGQAIIEGVLMRGGKFMAAGMRSPEGNIVIQKEKLAGIYLSNIRKIPFLRGIIILWDALGIGLRYLTISANIQTGDEEKIEGPTFYLTLGFSLLLGVGLFFVLPAAIGKGIEVLFHWSAWWGNLLEGVFRLFILVGYIWSVGKIPEIKRVFSYHGAEHKTINAFEAGAVLIPENVQRYSREHPRCGTSFLLTVVFLSVILFSLFGPLPTALRLLSRVIFIPVLVVVAYEYIRWTQSCDATPDNPGAIFRYA
jgi:uncharacterized protein YqhQ